MVERLLRLGHLPCGGFPCQAASSISLGKPDALRGLWYFHGLSALESSKREASLSTAEHGAVPDATCPVALRGRFAVPSGAASERLR